MFLSHDIKHNMHICMWCCGVYVCVCVCVCVRVCVCMCAALYGFSFSHIYLLSFLLQNPFLDEKFDNLQILCNIFIVKADNLKQVCSEDPYVSAISVWISM